MVQINFAKREVQCKVVYYGPACSGKTANLRAIHERTGETVRGALTTIATDTERTLFFDFLPLNLGQVAGIGAKINLYAVPYIDHQNATRLLVLEGIDGIVFVADSSPGKLKENAEALENLRGNLAALGRELSDVPIVFQWNKADVDGAVAEDELAKVLNPHGYPAFSATADTGAGVLACLKAVTQDVLVNVSQMMAASPATAVPEPVPEPEPEPEPAIVAAAASEPLLEPSPLPPWRQDPDAEFEPEPESVSIARAQTDEFAPLPPVEVIPAKAPPKDDVVAAEYEEAFGSVPPSSFQPPDAVREAAETLRRPRAPAPPPELLDLDWDIRPPEPPSGVTPDGQPRMVSVGGGGSSAPRDLPRVHSWDDQARQDREHYRATPPVVDRRRRPRSADRKNVLPTANLVAGAICTLVSLVAIGYLVHALL